MLLVGPGETVLSWALSLQPVIRPLPLSWLLCEMV